MKQPTRYERQVLEHARIAFAHLFWPDPNAPRNTTELRDAIVKHYDTSTPTTKEVLRVLSKWDLPFAPRTNPGAAPTL